MIQSLMNVPLPALVILAAALILAVGLTWIEASRS
jgi:hypothetical protein